MRFFAGLLILMLSGCGMAVSDKPMFTDADTAGAPQFADGVWLMSDTSDHVKMPRCDVDVAKPVSAWPACASWALYRDGEWLELNRETGAVDRPAVDMEVIGGDIALAQIRIDDLDDDPPPEQPTPPTYFFLAFDNEAAAGAKLRSIRLWAVMCGTHKPGSKPTDDDPLGELDRFAGFDAKCRPDSVATLRAAAAKSRTPETKFVRLRWARATLD